MAEESDRLVDPAVFDWLQSRLEDDQKTRDELRDIVHELEKQEKVLNAHLIKVFSVPDSQLPAALGEIQTNLVVPLVAQIGQLNETASQHPYYKFNGLWTRQMQDAVYAVATIGFLGGFGKVKEGQLTSLDEVGQILQIPVNVKDRDTFHLTIEEYLHGLVSVIEELARLARISVTMGNYQRPLIISQFVKDLHSGFQVLNLKNDSLRRRNDGIKYRIRDVEDVVYDLTLRGLINKPESAS